MISGRICTQLQLSIFNAEIVDIDVIMTICICAELNLSISNVYIDKTVSISFFFIWSCWYFMSISSISTISYWYWFAYNTTTIHHILTSKLSNSCRYRFAFVQNVIKYLGKPYHAYLKCSRYRRSQLHVYHFTILKYHLLYVLLIVIDIDLIKLPIISKEFIDILCTILPKHS